MFRGTALALIVLLFSSPSSAQSTRVESIAEEQAEKAKALGVEGPSDAELVVRRVLLSPLLSGGGGAYPWFGSVFGGSGMAIGAGYLKRLEKAASINVLAGISINNSQLLETRVAAPELFRGRLTVGAEASWTKARDVQYFGPGPKSNPDVDFEYDYQPTRYGADAAFKPLPWFSIGGGYSFLDLETQVVDLDLGVGVAPGIGRDLQYHISKAEAMIDWRTSPGYSTRGGLYRFSWERHEETNDKPYSFETQEYEISQLVPLVREQFVLAFRGLMTTTITSSGEQVPVMLAPYLGSGSTLRAYQTRRFTDRNRVLVTGEYRWRPSRYLDLAIFLDSGQVARDKRDFRLNDFETNWGIGARFHGPIFTAFRVEYARGREGRNIIFAGSQIF
jgi:hypothetical protein